MPDKRNGEPRHRPTEDLRRESTCSPSPRHRRAQKLRNLASQTEAFDTLHQKAFESVACSGQACLGSLMANQGNCASLPPDQVLRHAKDFLDQYYASIKRLNSATHRKRWAEVSAEVASRGTYHLTGTELVYGAKLAWRNAHRCIGRIQWSKLQVFDARFVSTPSGMFEAICNHIKYSTNKGNIRSAITVFPQRTDGKHDFRVWNPQLIAYAGYRQLNGSVVGDPASVDFTEVCSRLGWRGPGTQWDVLPLVLSADGRDPEYFDLPAELVLEVPLRHPNYPGFDELELRWYALPAVSSMLFDVGGVQFPAAPFNGWYMVTEIANRDLADGYRYDKLEKVALAMGLDTNSSANLWKDRALVELNYAVLHSFQALNVTIVDHHTASETFMKHLENEQRLRGGCPADWVWIVPPLSGSITPVFHQEMMVYLLKPSYEYQEAAWKVHVWKKGERGKGLGDRRRSTRKFRFKEIARAVKFTSKLFGKALSRRIKATVLYATETGRSEGYAQTLVSIFGHAFNAQVCCMAEYDAINLEHEALVLVVTSTFGNGDPPENGEEFARDLYELKVAASTSELANSPSSRAFIKMGSQSEEPQPGVLAQSPNQNASLEEFGPLGNVRFAVFALGSSAYPNFCSFGRCVDKLLGELGAERLVRLATGDELGGQEGAFRAWAGHAFRRACDTFCVGDDTSLAEATAALDDGEGVLGRIRLALAPNDLEQVNLCKGLAKAFNKPVTTSRLDGREDLLAPGTSQRTLLVRLAVQAEQRDLLTFCAGDHIGICPENDSTMVDVLISLLTDVPPEDHLIQIQVLKEHHTPNGPVKAWASHERLPVCPLRTLLSRYLDITTPPSPPTLAVFASLTNQENDRTRLLQLSKETSEYESWKFSRFPNLVEVLQEFRSVSLPASALPALLPALQPRFYSISSSPKLHPDEIHLTVGLLAYAVPDGSGRMHYGVGTHYLDTCPIGSTIHCFIRAAPSFRLPDDPNVPVVMVGPGTGLAPFRSFWQEHMIRTRGHEDKGEIRLYFGCRTPDAHLYRHEMQEMQELQVLNSVSTAYSRMPGQPKVYVQDLLRETRTDVYSLVVEKRGHFYVCGDVAMAEDVQQTLRQLIASGAGMQAEDAEAYILSMRDENRYHEDIFGITFRVAEVQSQRLERNRTQLSQD